MLLCIFFVTWRLKLLPAARIFKKKKKFHYNLSVSEFVYTYALGVWLFLIVALTLFLPVCQVWSLAMVATDLCLGPKSDPDLEIPWAQHPFGRQLLESL